MVLKLAEKDGGWGVRGWGVPLSLVNIVITIAHFQNIHQNLHGPVLKT